MSATLQQLSKVLFDTKRDQKPLTLEDEKSTTEDQNMAKDTLASVGTLRLSLSGNLTIVQGIILCNLASAAWLFDRQSMGLQQLPAYGKILCVQYILLFILRLFHSYVIDGLRQVKNEKGVLNIVVGSLDIMVNVLCRLVISMILLGGAVYTGFQLRDIQKQSFISWVIRGSTFCNFALLLHMSGATLNDCDFFVQSTSSPSNRVTRRVLGILRIIIAGCKGIHITSHLWPLSEGMLTPCTIALGVYVFRRSLDKAWSSAEAVNQILVLARQARHMICTIFIFFVNYIHEIILAIFRLNLKYLMKILRNLYYGSTQSKKQTDSEAEEEEPTKDE